MTIDPLTMILLPTAINFVTGRLDAKVSAPALDGLLRRFQKRPQPVNHDLQKALHKSFFLALHDIASECRQQLHQSSPGDRGIRDCSDIQWLKRQIKDLEKILNDVDRLVEREFQQVQQQSTEADTALGFWIEIETLIRLQGQSAECLIEVKQKMLAKAPCDRPNPPQCYLEKVEKELLKKVYDHFMDRMKLEDKVFRAFMVECQKNLMISVDNLPQVIETTLKRELDTLKQEFWQTGYPGQAQQIDSTLDATIIKVHSPGSHSAPNPFLPLTGIVDDPQLFFGREREIRRVFETLNSGSSVALIGQRAVGKSSLLNAICLHALTELQKPRKPIYLNMQHIYDEDDFYGALCDEVGIAIAKGHRFFRALRKHRLLLVLDEIEKISWEGFTNHVRGQLRGLAEGSDAPVRLVIATCTSLDRLFPDSQAEGMTSPFTGICIEEQIGIWDEITARAFINSRLKSTNVRFTEAEISQLLAASGGHPRTLMQLCYQKYSRYLENQQ